MRIFDLHADIGHNLLFRKDHGDTEVLREQHIPKLLSGEVLGVGVASFFEGHEDLKHARAMVANARKEILANPEAVHPYLGGQLHPSKINACMTVEGMGFIKRNPEAVLDWLYAQGVRIGSLCWNDANALATGLKGSSLRGLTPLGERAIRHMNRIGMIIDVSHANEKTFWDILRITKKPVIATHSNSRRFSNVDRNLTDQQAKALIEQGGLIGLVAARKFISQDESLQDARQLAEHALHFKALGGIQTLAIGFDYMDFLGDEYGRKAMAKDLQDATQSQNLIRGLSEAGFSETEINAIAWDNTASFLEKNL